MNEDVKIINTEEGLKSTKKDCPNCGSSDITFNSKSGKLHCNYCKTDFNPKELNNIKNVDSLNQRVIGSGAKDINSNIGNMITIECSNCGAEVVIDTSVSTQVRCHWCRGILSINNRIENGSIPDAILPFSVKKEEAMEEINKFVGKRKFHALPKFKEEFKAENVFGVYFPYMIVDAKVNCAFEGNGEHLLRQYSYGKNDTRYDAEEYYVIRNFNINVDDLTIESNKSKINKSEKSTNNIINSIMPFDTDNCVKFESNYLVGFTSEKRDLNIKNIEEKVKQEVKDIARISINDTLKKYDRGVCWKKEKVEFEGSQWISAYLPVWLYTFEDKKGVRHYIAVNGRTKETMGSIPINNFRLNLITFFIEFICIFTMLMFCYETDDIIIIYCLMAIMPGIIYNKIIKDEYRNKDARHKYENETKRMINYSFVKDDFMCTKRRLKNRYINGYNSNIIYGENINVNAEKK